MACGVERHFAWSGHLEHKTLSLFLKLDWNFLSERKGVKFSWSNNKCGDDFGDDVELMMMTLVEIVDS